MKNQKLRRILTFIFTLTFIVSTVLGTLPAFASSTDKTDLVTVNNSAVFKSEAVINEKENALAGILPYINTYHADAGTVKADADDQNNPGTVANLTDGDFDSEWRHSQGLYGNGTDWFFEGTVYNKMAFDLGKSQDITDIVVAHSTTSGLATGKYKVYVSAEKDSLFDAANLVADVDNTTTNKIQQTISTNEGKTLNGRYVGFIITMPCCATGSYGNSAIYARIREIGVYVKDTTPLPDARATLDTADDGIDLPVVDDANGETNLTSGRVATFYKNTAGKDIQVLPDTTEATKLAASEAKLKLLTDGATDKGGEAYSFVGYDFRFGSKDPNTFYNGRYSAAFVYDLGTSFELTKLALIHGDKGTLATSHYMVYASNNRDNLFKDDNFVLEVKNTGANQRNLITFNDGVKAQYVGIRIWDPCSDYTQPVLADTPTNAYVRMREIAVYGKAVEAGLFTPSADDSTDTDATLGNSNLLSGKAVTKINYYAPGVTEQRYDNDGKLTDGDTSETGEWRQSHSKFADTANDKVIGNGINIGDYKMDIIFGLGSTHEITGFEVFNATNNNGNTLANYRYQIYIADTQSELFYPENMVIDYTNGDAAGRNAFKLTDGKTAPQGKYYGLRILDPTCSKTVSLDWIYPRVRELTLYGKRIVSAADAIIMDESREIPTDLYSGTNIATQAKVESWFMNLKGNYVKVTASTDDGDMIDGVYDTEYRSSPTRFVDDTKTMWIGNGIDEGEIYQDVYIDLNYISNITGLTLINSPTAGLATYKYQLFFANTKKELFKGTPFKDMTITNTDGSDRNSIDLSYLNGDAPISARFLGIRVLDPTNKKPTDVDPTNCYLRLRDVAVFGTLTSEGADPEPDYDVLNDDTIALPEDWGTNIALNQLPATYSKGKNGYLISNSKNTSYLSDGNVKTEFEEQSKLIEIVDATGEMKNDHTSFGDGAWYTDIIYDFKTEVTVDGFALIHHPTFTMITRHFQVYVGDKKTTLFEADNMVYEMENTEPFRRNAYNLKGKGKSTKGRYFAIRVLAPTQDPLEATSLYGLQKNAKNEDVAFNHVYTRLMELAIYGTYTNPDFVYVEPFTPFITAPEDSYFSDNLLLGKVYDNLLFNGQNMNSGRRTETTGGVLTNGLTKTPYGEEIDPDGNLRQLTHYDFGGSFSYAALDGTQFTDMIWDLGKNYDFSKFAMLSSVSTASSHYTGWYRLYVSDDYDLLFDDSSIAFEYNALDSEEPDTICAGQEVDFQKSIFGRYIAIRILNPVYTATEYVRPRIVEVGIWGEEAEVDLTPVNLTDKMPVTAYLGEIGSLAEIDDITIKEIDNLADGDNSTGATIKTNGKTLHLIYNLCQDAEVYELFVNSLEGKTNLKNYKIYASDTQTGVWDEDALIYTHSGSSATGEKKFADSTKMRYIRIEVLDKADKTYIGDIQVIGPKAIQQRNKNLIKNINDIGYNYYLQDLESGEIEYLNTNTAGINSALIHNGLTNMATNVNGAIKGESTMNVIIDMADLRTVNSFRLDLPKRAKEYYPTETYVYFGENADKVQAVDAEPDLTFKGLPEENFLEANFVPKTARFIRVCFADAGENYGADHLIVALTEITVNGTGIVGMNLGERNVINFEDKDLGIKWGIVRDTTNDILTDVASSEVIVGDATNWQKRSLEKTPYLKVVGGKTYTFKFYDIAGKEIKDFGGREIEMSFKLRDEMEAATSMVGYSGNKWYVEVYESNTSQYENYVTTYVKGMTENITFSPLCIVKSDDEYWSTIGELEDYGDEKPEYAPNADIDDGTSADPIITEDGNFSINPMGALRLPVDAQLLISYTTYTLTQDVYDAVLPLTDPNYIAATYSVRLVQQDLDYLFDGKIKVSLKIPEVLDGYFTSYKLIHMYDIGGAEFVEYTLEDDNIIFETNSLSKFVLVGEGYNAKGDAELQDPSTDTPVEDTTDDTTSQPDNNGTIGGNDNLGNSDGTIIGDNDYIADGNDGFTDDFIADGNDSLTDGDFIADGNDVVLEGEDVIIDTGVVPKPEVSPETGDSFPVIYLIISMISLAAIVILNSKKLRLTK